MAEPSQDCGGANEHARAKWAGQFETRGYLVEYTHFARSAAVSIIANSMVGHPLDAKYHVYVYYYTANRRLCMGVPPYRSVSYQNFVGALPPQVKYCGGACPPCPPGSAAYEWLLVVAVCRVRVRVRPRVQVDKVTQGTLILVHLEVLFQPEEAAPY